MAITHVTLIATTIEATGIPFISRDGRYLALTNSRGATSFVDAALKDSYGLLLVDLHAGTAKSLVHDSAAGQFGSPSTSALGIKSDGSTVLVSNIHDGVVKLPAGSPSSFVYLEDTSSTALTPISQYPGGFIHLTGLPASLSADGKHIVVGRGVEYGQDGMPLAYGVFELDTQTGAVTRIAVTQDYTNADQGDPYANNMSVSGDGRFVVFDSAAAQGRFDLPAYRDLLVYDAVKRDIQPVNTSTGGTLGDKPTFGFSISGNGRYVVFGSSADNLVPGTATGSTNVFVKDLQTGAIVNASTDAYGQAYATYAIVNWIAQGISDDGRFVVFQSSDSFGIKELESSMKKHIFVKDLVTGALALVNSTPETIGLDAIGAAISGDGSTIVFEGIRTVSGATTHSEYLTYAFPLPAFTPVTVNDTMTGTAGADTLAGALGDDVYFVNDRRDIVVEYANQGNDTIHAAVDYTLPDNVETLVLEGSAALSGTGNSLANTLVGNGAGNSLHGGAGDDIFEGKGGNDWLFGEAGHDTALFSGKLADYDIKVGPITTVVAKAGGSAGNLTSIETLVFNDAIVTFETGGVAAQAYRLYQAAFDRKPDPGGLGYWIAAMEKGMDLTGVAALFVQSNEFKELCGPSPSNASFVDLLYQHVLHRPADKGGAAFWTGVLDQHAVTAADVLAQFSESPENQAALIGAITNGIAYQPYHG